MSRTRDLDDPQRIFESIKASLSAFMSWSKSGGSDSASATDNLLNLNQLQSLEDSLTEATIQVRKILNGLAPVNRLPTDVLKTIFEYLSPTPISGAFDTQDPHYRRPREAGSPPSHQLELYHWHRTTLVCRRWRSVALSCPSLWSTIAIGPDKMPNKMFDMQLQYSGQAPLDLHLGSDVSIPGMLECTRYSWKGFDLRSLVPRLRELHLHPLTQDKYRPELLQELTVPAPLLECLTLRPEFTTPEMRRGILPTLFTDQTPRLKALTLVFFCSWPGNNFRNLTRLCLYDQTTIDFEDENYLNMDCAVFIQLLMGSPQLEELVLVHPAPLADPPKAKPALDLRRLKMLFIDNWDMESTILLLSWFQVPSTCVVHLGSRLHASYSEDMLRQICSSSAFDNLAPCLRNITRLYLRTNNDSPSLHAVFGCGTSGFYLRAPSARLPSRWHDVEFAGSPYIGSFADIPVSEGHLQLYSVMSVTELWVEIDHHTGAPVSQWQKLYCALQGVTTLVVVAKDTWGEPNFNCMEALGSLSEGHECLPDLAEIHIVLPPSSALSDALLVRLEKMKTERETLGIPVDTVTIGPKFLQVPRAEAESIQKQLGSESLIRTQDLTFDLSPFGTYKPQYAIDFWPKEFSRERVDLWPVHIC